MGNAGVWDNDQDKDLDKDPGKDPRKNRGARTMVMTWADTNFKIWQKCTSNAHAPA